MPKFVQWYSDKIFILHETAQPKDIKLGAQFLIIMEAAQRNLERITNGDGKSVLSRC